MSNQHSRNHVGRRVGLYLIGARGSVASTTIIGLYALAANLTAPIGLATETDDFRSVPLVEFDDIVVGGHDITDTAIVKNAEHLVASGLVDRGVVQAIWDRLEEVEENIVQVARPSHPQPFSHGESQQSQISRIADHINTFRQRNHLDRVVVIDVSSTEPPITDHPALHDPALLLETLANPRRAILPASSVGALAALEAHAAYACFTPSPALTPPAIQELAVESTVPYAGQDAKTGQTLLRTAIAPMFRHRALHVTSWAGTNLLGGGDGSTLSDPIVAESKLNGKHLVLDQILGRTIDAPCHIDNVPDLGETKVAWDHVRATGFLGSPITLQTTWTAFDSALAAPLVLDLTRLLALAAQSGQRGVIQELGFYFKNPWGDGDHHLEAQYLELVEWARRTSAAL